MKITSYEVLGKLPDLFTFEDGSKVTSVADWKSRRKELLKTAVELQYGDILPSPEVMEVTPLTYPNTPGRINIWKITAGTNRHQVSFSIYAHRPKGEGPWPVVIDGDLCYRCMQDPSIVNKFLEKGIMLVTFNRTEIMPDIRNPRRTGNLYETYADKTFGAIAAWAWGFSRALDALIQLGLADLSCVAFTGLSRGGKAALLAGALDERATIVNPEAACACGTSCFRIHMKALTENGKELRSETLKDIINNFPDWFNPAMKAYEDDEASLPFDSHSLKALIAPRVFLDCQAKSDIWAGPVNTYQTNIAAREAWKLYGKPENVLWYWRSGEHDQLPEDFDMLIQVIQNQRFGTPLCEKFMQLPFEAPTPIYDWECPK